MPILIALGILLLTETAAFAQTSATIVGVVQDETGGVLPDAEVTARHLETGAVPRVPW